MKWNVLVFVFFLYCSNIGQVRALLPKVCLDESNCVLGKFMRGFETHLFEAFLGIPYAQPPIGDLRFSNPEEAKPWNGTLEAKVPKPDCVQKNYIKPLAPITGSEDCLYLNVYRPVNKPNKNLPVLFYIHGGGFFSGSPNPLVEGPEYFMDTKEVILVVPAYRLGLFGFLSTNDEQMTGNFGLKDQNLALKWVNTFISAFGGDPDRVTIFGHSAGSASVHFHTLSPASKGLFQNAILMSGAANAFYAKPLDDPKAQVIELAESAGIKRIANLNSSDLVKALRKLSPNRLLRAADGLKSWNIYPLVTFRPNIENSQWPNSFLTEDIFSSLAENSGSISVPWIIGNVPSKGEGLVMALRLASNPILRANFNKKFDNLLRTILEFPDTSKTSAVINCAVSKYMNGVHELNDETLDGFLELLGDASFIYPTYKTIQAYVNNRSYPDSSNSENSSSDSSDTSKNSSENSSSDSSDDSSDSAESSSGTSESSSENVRSSPDSSNSSENSSSDSSSDSSDTSKNSLENSYSDSSDDSSDTAESSSGTSESSSENMSKDKIEGLYSLTDIDEVTANLKGIIKFNYRGPYSFSTTFTGSFKNFSTVHTDDSLFLFKAPLSFPFGYLKISPEAALVRRYVGLYVEFAKTGKVEELEKIGTCTSVSLEEGKCEYLSIVKSREPFQTDNSWDIERLKCWAGIYH